MFDEFKSSKRSDLAGVPVEMPIDVLLALPGYVTNDPGAPLFNLPGVIAVLLGRFGYERATKILKPWIWAPGWADADLHRFVTSSFLDHPSLFRGAPAVRLRVATLPDAGPSGPPAPTALQRFEVVHFLGHVEWQNGERALKLDEARDSWLNVTSLHGMLVKAKTRLLILQVPRRQFETSTEIARSLVDAGVPAAVVVAARDPAAANVYLMGVYANMIHNMGLVDVARPKPSAEPDRGDLTVHLHYSEGSEDILQFHQWLLSLQGRFDRVLNEVRGRAQEDMAHLAELRARISKQMLHESQVSYLETRFRDVENRLPRLRSKLETQGDELGKHLNWAHESGGAEPLSRIADLVPALEAEAQQLEEWYPALQEEIRAAAEQAPRVLNANFGDPAAHRVLDPLEGLVAGQEYDLLVDVGPVWNTVPTIVSGNGGFPEQALSPDENGHVIDVVCVSDDFTPGTAAGQIWLPRRSGRSHPWVDGQRAAASGPIGLRVKAPGFPTDQTGDLREACGRLFLYYKNNLVQSAVIKAGVVRTAAVKLERRNTVEVDYTLTASFQQLEERLATREVRLAADDSKASHPVGVNITLNHDARGSHRILVRKDNDSWPAWMAYDPAAAGTFLDKARNGLLDCYWWREANGQFVYAPDGQRRGCFNERNGKPLMQLRHDLFHLAKLGNRLYYHMFDGLRTDAPDDQGSTWKRQFRQRLATSTIIQVSRIESSPLQYAFPWALVYDYPLTGTTEQIRWCDVLWEWSEDGIRSQPLADSCPFADEPWHRENVLCPYGFWGLKHLIEQPLAFLDIGNEHALRGAVDRIPVGRDARLSVGWTQDQAMDLTRIKAHVERILGLPGMRRAEPLPNPADTRDTVRAVLANANCVYFICHCERDQREDEPYLCVGPRDGLEAHRIYANTVSGWAQSALAGWGDLRPLVIINGCHTSDLRPGEILSFVSAFRSAGAAGVIGTEISVKLPLAMEIAESLFQKLLDGRRVGQAVREMRWELADKGNLLGLCYTPYCLSDLHFVKG